MRLRLLGPIEVWDGRDWAPIKATKQRELLAMLMLHPGRVLDRDWLIDMLWDQQAPPSAARLLPHYVWRLRGLLAGGAELQTAPSGYVLTVDAENVDSEVFAGLLAGGRTAAAQGNLEEAIKGYTAALDLWRGPALADARSVPLLETAAQRLDQQRIQTRETLADALLAAGRHSDALDTLEELTTTEPFRERPWRLLMLALYRAERRPEALAAYQRLWRTWTDQLGLEPGQELQELHHRILADDPSLVQDTAPSRRGAGDQGIGREPVRCTLPADQVVFVGRSKELNQIATALTAAARTGGVIAIHAIDGMPGIGKTALAVHVAHRLKDRFGDRQLFIDLHAHTPGHRPTDPMDALADLLAADGADTRTLPSSVDGRSAVWRGRMAGKRVLLVLDNAASTEQVTPLLPGTPGALVLVTSRRSLGDLPSCLPVPLDVLPHAEAAAMVTRLAPHLAGQPEAITELVAACGHLPLAISITAQLLARRRSWTVGDLLGEIRQTGDRLLHLTIEQRTIAAVFDLSYHTLDPDRQRFFRLLGLHPGVDIDAYAAAALTAGTLDEAQQHLDGLHRDRLLTEPAYRRYRMHDLTRAYTRTLTAATDPEQVRDTAVERLLDFYQHTAARADDHLAAYTSPTAIPLDQSQSTPPIADWETASAWLRAERANLLACIRHTTSTGMHKRTAGLTATIAGLLRIDGPWPQAAILHQAAVVAAQQIDDRHSYARALNDLAETRHLTSDYAAAADLLGQALDAYRSIGDRWGAAIALCELGSVRWVTGDYPAAIELLTQGLDLFRAVGDHRGEATALCRMGNVKWAVGDYPAAADLLERALNRFRTFGHRRGEANALYGLGCVHWVTGTYSTAADLLGQAVDLYQDIGYQLGEATSLNQLAAVQRLTGNYAAAAQLLARSLALFRLLGEHRGEAIALSELAVVRRLAGDYPAATDLLTRVLALYRAWNHRHGEAITHSRLAVVAHLTDDHARAVDLLHQALAVFKQVGARDDQAEALNQLGIVQRRTGHPDQAQVLHQQALDIARDINHRLEEAHAREGIGRAVLDLGQTDAGLTHLRQAFALYQQLGVPEADQIAAELAALTPAFPPHAATQPPPP